MWPWPLRPQRLGQAGRSVFTAIQWLCAWHLFAEHIGGPRVVAGPSMLPTMNNTDDIVIEDCLSARLSPPRIKRGDLITFLSPIHPGRTVCKRVIGLPGDTVCVDPTIAQHTNGDGEPNPNHVLIPEGHVWVAGDNTSCSRDSRTYGPVPIALVRGKVFARIYPNPRWFTNPTMYID